MKHDGFDERLDGILVRAAIRLQERMRLAYSRGNLSAYLNRIGLGKLLEPSLLERGSLLELQDEAAIAMARAIRKARLRGYLKDFLEQINMLELLDYGKEEKVHKPSRGHEHKVKKKKSYLKMVEGENKRSAMSEAEKKELLKNFKVIKT
ncbi:MULTISPECIES: hypothetical protein [Selenomonas]|uniref:Uncharacterized protein n=1 Tax=Selenomonas ruminis TaxID=2593411 RepID=A0A5D6W7Q7_9FIRM|nr:MULTISPECIES: hypothetical protein [unclassified Selenomonas]MBQ1866677.1 hypothetical protein [Selenomonas sp.]TYZ24491.1 hypothetical protein FZ040_00125 [Selenomonas sp. mPRGC5]